MKRRILIDGLEDPQEAMELLLSVAEALELKGFQARASVGRLEVLVEGGREGADDLVKLAEDLWPGASIASEPYEGRVMDLDMFKRVLHAIEHPDERA